MAIPTLCIDYGRIGIGICYDIRFPEMAMIAARRGSCRFEVPEMNFTIIQAVLP
jgi:predicted amidohydrolase